MSVDVIHRRSRPAVTIVRPLWGLITNHRSCFHLDDDDDFGGVVGVPADESQHVDAQLAWRFLGDGHREHVAVLLARGAAVPALVFESLLELACLYAMMGTPFSNSTRNIALERASTIVPSCSIAPCFAI